MKSAKKKPQSEVRVPSTAERLRRSVGSAAISAAPCVFPLSSLEIVSVRHESLFDEFTKIIYSPCEVAPEKRKSSSHVIAMQSRSLGQAGRELRQFSYPIARVPQGSDEGVED